MIPLFYFGVSLSIIDFKSHRLPNRVVGWFTFAEVVILSILSWLTADFGRLIEALGVAIATLITYLLLYLLSRGALGMGDVKFAFPLGLCIGWYSPEYWLIAIFAAFILAAVVATIGMAIKRVNRKSMLAFGPYMFLGTLLFSLI
jgi:leader peptidase (prepilin peptidase) / N-methyltransferase